MDNRVSTEALVLIAAVGGIGALLGALLTALVNVWLERGRRKADRSIWLRERQYDEYTALMVAAGDLHMFMWEPSHSADRARRDKFEEAGQRYRNALERAILITPGNKADELRDLGAELSGGAYAEDRSSQKVAASGKKLRKFLQPYLTG